MQATPLDASGAPVAVPVMWTSSDPAVVALTGTGATVGLRAAGPGTATVSASAGGQQAAVTITVLAEQLARFALLGPSTVLIGKTVVPGLDAVGRRGTAIRPVDLAMTSSDTAVLAITSVGQVVGRSAGTVVLTARALGATTTTTIRVMPVQVAFEMVIDPAIPAAVAAGLRAAAVRWGEVFSAPWPATTVTAASTCVGVPALSNEPLPQPRIYVSIQSDSLVSRGAAGVVAAGGPCLIRNGYPMVSRIMLTANASATASRDYAYAVGLHEMGHVIGFGTRWRADQYQGSAASGYVFLGPEAVSAYTKAGGAGPVPFDPDGVAHWNRTRFPGEVMNYAVIGGAPPMVSAITLGAFADLGLPIRYDGADPYRVSGASAVRGALAGRLRADGPSALGAAWLRASVRDTVITTLSP